MWTSSCSKVFKSIKREAIWQRWSDVNTWHEWIPNIESCRLEKPFASGNSFTLKPKGSPEVVVKLLNVKKDQTFTGCTRFFGATMYDIHEMHQDPQGLRLTVTLKVTGPLGFLWRKLVAEKIEANLPTLLKNLAGAASAPDYKKSLPNIQRITPTDHKPKLHLITSGSQKPKKAQSKSKSKSRSKSQLKISTTALKKTNALFQSIPHESITANRKVESSMFTATQPKLSTPALKPSIKKPKAKAAASRKPKAKKVTLASKKAKTKTTKAKKSTASKSLKAKSKKTTAKKAKSKTRTLASKKTKSKSASASKKASAKPKAKAKAKTTKSKASKPKTKAKSKASSKARA